MTRSGRRQSQLGADRGAGEVADAGRADHRAELRAPPAPRAPSTRRRRRGRSSAARRGSAARTRPAARRSPRVVAAAGPGLQPLEAAARSAGACGRGGSSGWRRAATAESTWGGRRRAKNAQTPNADRGDAPGRRCRSRSTLIRRRRTPPSTSVEPSPKIVSRAFASVRVMPCGTSRGAAAARIDRVRLGQHQRAERARVEHQQFGRVRGHDQREHARPTAVPAMAQRRPCCNRSSAGPMTGATTANGAMVISR